MSSKFFLLLSLSLLALTLAQADTTQEVRALRREAYALQSQMKKLVPNIEERDPELATLLNQAAETQAALHNALKTHPALADARAQKDAAYNQLINAVGKGDEAAKQAAKEACQNAEHALNNKAREVPDIAPISIKAAELGVACMTRREAAYAAQPETAEMAKKAQELLARASALRKAAN